MQVSFGDLYISSEPNHKRTAKQFKTSMMIERTINNQRNLDAEQPDIIDQLELKGSDLSIIALKNGNVKMQVEREMPGSHRRYVPFYNDEDERLECELNLKRPNYKKIQEQINNFLRKCRNYTYSPDCRTNEEIDDYDLDILA